MTDATGPHFILSGYRSGAGTYDQSAYGVYWSNSAYIGATQAYNLRLNGTNSTLNPANGSGSRTGFSLRCLACPNQRNVKKYRNTYRLPTGNTTGEFQSLYNQYPTYDQMRKYPVGMVLGGYFAITGPNYQGTGGRYWSSSAYTDATRAHNLYLDGTDSIVGPARNGNKYSGFSLRCLAKNQIKNKKFPKLINKKQNNKKRKEVPEIPHASQPVALLENTKLSTITIIAIPL